MTGFQIGAAIIAALFALNFIVFLVRRGMRPRDAGQAPRPVVRNALPRGESAIYAVMAASWLVCVAAPDVAPGSALARTMAQPWAFACLVAWTMAVALGCSVAVAMWRRRRPAVNR